MLPVLLALDGGPRYGGSDYTPGPGDWPCRPGGGGRELSIRHHPPGRQIRSGWQAPEHGLNGQA